MIALIAVADQIPGLTAPGHRLSPLLQWFVIPLIVLWLTRRHLLSAQVLRNANG